MEREYNFVAISGSLRKGSYNTMALKALQKLAPENIHIEIISIADFPFYNADNHEPQAPEQVEKLNDAIILSDAVIFATPEYNYSIPASLKNAIDFISRSKKKPLDMKAVGILGASPGMFGSARAQYHLRQVMTALNAFALNRPEIMISQVHTKFDESGNLIDEKTKEILNRYIIALAEFSDILKRKD